MGKRWICSAQWAFTVGSAADSEAIPQVKCRVCVLRLQSFLELFDIDNWCS